MGTFADALGEDVLGLRELGIAQELGLSSLSIPKRLLKGKKDVSGNVMYVGLIFTWGYLLIRVLFSATSYILQQSKASRGTPAISTTSPLSTCYIQECRGPNWTSSSVLPPTVGFTRRHCPSSSWGARTKHAWCSGCTWSPEYAQAYHTWFSAPSTASTAPLPISSTSPRCARTNACIQCLTYPPIVKCSVCCPDTRPTAIATTCLCAGGPSEPCTDQGGPYRTGHQAEPSCCVGQEEGKRKGRERCWRRHRRGWGSSNGAVLGNYTRRGYRDGRRWGWKWRCGGIAQEGKGSGLAACHCGQRIGLCALLLFGLHTGCPGVTISCARPHATRRTASFWNGLRIVLCVMRASNVFFFFHGKYTCSIRLVNGSLYCTGLSNSTLDPSARQHWRGNPLIQTCLRTAGPCQNTSQTPTSTGSSDR